MKGPIKIVRIMDRLNVGGPAIHAALASRGLSLAQTEGAFDTLLVHGRVEPGEEEMAHLFDSGIRREFVPTLARPLSPLADSKTFWRILKILRRERPDVVHTHKSKAGALGRLAAWLCRVPVRVHTFHGQVFEGYFSSTASRWIVRVERFLAKLSHAILALSPALQEELAVRYRIAPKEKVRLVPLGLDLEPLARPSERRRLQRECGLDPKRPSIGIVGRLVPVKNHALFLEAARELAEERPELLFFIVGGGELEEPLKAQSRRLGLDGRVHFTGFRKDLPEVYASLDVLALTSDNEGTPVVLIEALAAGVPVAASDVGGVPDVLQNGRLGKLFARADKKALAQALRDTLARAPEAAQQERARRHMMERYAAGRLCKDLAGLYLELLGLSPAGGATVKAQGTLRRP